MAPSTRTITTIVARISIPNPCHRERPNAR
jgi:hypothetical protein